MADTYEVTAQQQSTDINGAGQLVDVMRVTFATVPEGVVGTVTVPLATYSAQVVAAAILERVAEIKAVAGL